MLSEEEKKRLGRPFVPASAVSLLIQAHDKLDDLNAQFGEKGDLCLCCHAQRHHSDIGILHRNWCLIAELRRYLHND